MHLILVRHGEPDYGPVTERHYIGHGRDLAPLTAAGAAQAEAVSKDPVLKRGQLIVASPYTRAMQTAAIISKNTGIDLTVEVGLHEWLPDTDFLYDSEAYSREASKECTLCRGEQREGTKYRWESLASVAKRSYEALYRYTGQYECVIAVCHGNVMRQFVFQGHIPYCGILELEFDQNTKWPGFNEKAYERFLQQ